MSHGVNVQFSERFLAKMSGTTSQGNTLQNVVAALMEYGLVLDTDWPEPVNFTLAEYYAPIPQEIINKGKATLAKYLEVSGFELVSNLSVALQDAPCIVFTPKGVPTHARCVLGQNLVFDTFQQESDTTSLGPYLETMPVSVHAFYQLKLSLNKNMFELFSADGHRVYAVLNGFRFWVLDPATEQNGSAKLWNLPINQDPSVLNLPYGGTLFVSSTDDPK